jgi:hypothetical protein
MNEHFLIYESANHDSLAQQVLEGAFTVEQLRAKAKNASEEELKIIKENAVFCGKYNKLIEEGLFGFGAPNQRGILRKTADAITSRMGGIKGQTRNKLIEIYQKVWKEFNTYIKKQSALGNDNAATFGNVQKFLGQLGIDPALIGTTFTNGEYAMVDQATTQSKNDLAKFIYQVLQAHYQGGKTNTKYRPPANI